MSFDTKEALREVYERLVENGGKPSNSIKEEFITAVALLNRDLSKSSNYGNLDNVVTMCLYIASPMGCKVEGLVELYTKLSNLFSTDNCLILGLLILQANIPPASATFKSDILPVLARSVTEGCPNTKASHSSQSPTTRPWIPRFIFLLASFKSSNIDHPEARKIITELPAMVSFVTDPWALKYVLNILREYIFLANQPSPARLGQTMSIEQFSKFHSGVKMLLAKIYEYDGAADPRTALKRLNQKETEILSQTLCENLVYRLSIDNDMLEKYSVDNDADVGMEFTQEIRWIETLGKPQHLFGRLMSRLCVQSTLPSHDQLVLNLARGVQTMHIVKHVSEDLIAKVMTVMSFNQYQYLKEYKIDDIASAEKNLNFVYKALILSHDVKLSGSIYARLLKEFIYSIYNFLRDLVKECPKVVTVQLIDRLMTQSRKRKSKELKAKEIDLVLWIIYKAITKQVDVGTPADSSWANFFETMRNYITNDFEEPGLKLSLLLSCTEFMLALISKAFEEPGLMDLYPTLESIKKTMETLFNQTPTSNFVVRTRYLHFKLTESLQMYKRGEEYDFEGSIEIKQRLEEIRYCLVEDSKHLLGTDMKITIIKNLDTDPKLIKFATKLHDSNGFIKTLSCLGQIARLHHCYSLAAICGKYSLITLLYTDRPQDTSTQTTQTCVPTQVDDRQNQQSKMDLSFSKISVLAAICSDLLHLNDNNVVPWTAYTLDMMKEVAKSYGVLGTGFEEQVSAKKGAGVPNSQITKHYKHLYLSAWQDMDRVVYALGPELLKDANFVMPLRSETMIAIIETVKKHKNCVKHFACYIKFIEAKALDEEDPYLRAGLLKELINSVKCLKDLVCDNIYSSNNQAVTEENMDQTTQLMAHLRDSKLTYTNLGLTFRRVLNTCVEIGYSLQMYNFCSSCLKLLENLAGMTMSLDDHLKALQVRSSLRYSHGKDDTIGRFLDFCDLDVENWVKPKTSCKKGLEEEANKEKIIQAIKKTHISTSKEDLVKLLVNVFNDVSHQQNKPVAVVFQHKLQKMAICLSVGLSESFRSRSLRASLESFIRKTCHGDFDLTAVANLLFKKGTQLPDMGQVALTEEINSFISILETLFEDRRGQLKLDLCAKEHILSALHISLLNMFFTRLESFNRQYEEILVSVAHFLFWKAFSLGLNKISRDYLETIMHFVYCHSSLVRQQAQRTVVSEEWRRFCLDADQIAEMAQVSANISYDLKRYIKFNSLDITKRRESFGRRSLRRLTIRKAGELSEFYKYSMYFNGRSEPTPVFLRNLAKYRERPIGQNVVIMGKYSNLLDYCNRQNELTVIFRFDGNKWVYSVQSETLAAQVGSMVTLIQDNEKALRSVGGSDGPSSSSASSSTSQAGNAKVSEQWWDMRKKFESRMEGLLKEIEEKLGDDILLFDYKFKAIDTKYELHGTQGEPTNEEIRLAALADCARLNTSQYRVGSATKYSKQNSFTQTQHGFSTQDSAPTNASMYLILEGGSYLTPFEHLSMVSHFKSDIFRLPHISECPTLDGTTFFETVAQTKVTKYSYDLRNDNFTDVPKCYYLLNPTGDLKKTESRMKNLLTKFLMWQGLVGSEPRASEIANFLKKNCNFL